ncbi:MAG: CheF family chemotaxis protein [Haloplanus sp.]
MTDDIVADFTTDVALSDEEATPSRMRVVLNDRELVFATGDGTRSIPLGRVLDIVQDISSRATPNSTETIRLAFRVGEVREVASVHGDAATLLRFQHALFRTLLDGTTTVVRHVRNGSRRHAARELSLSPTATRVRFEDDGATAFAVPREAVSEFRSGHELLDDDRQAAVTLFWRDDGVPAKTVICLPTPRLFNLFGRYLQSTARLESGSDGDERPRIIDVLLVDDDPDDLEMSELFLKRQSDRFGIERATSAAGGLDHLADGSTDCVVSDFDMPGTDGIEFLQAVRERHPNLPFILFTGQGSERVAKQAIIDDVTDYVEKGVGTNQYAVLAQRIRKAVDRSGPS